MSDIGPMAPGWWQTWQFSCRMGATSLVKVTSGAASALGPFACCAATGASWPAARAASRASTPVATIFDPVRWVDTFMISLLLERLRTRSELSRALMQSYGYYGFTRTTTYPFDQQHWLPGELSGAPKLSIRMRMTYCPGVSKVAVKRP